VRDYDVVVIGGGINGLTVGAYLAKAGLSVGVFEARGQCGAHCDTVELGIPGFLHNLHATWLVPSMSPAMADLDLEGFGLDLRGTDALYAKPFLDGSNLCQFTDLALTEANLGRASEHDLEVQRKVMEYVAENAMEALEVNRKMNFSPPSAEIEERYSRFLNGILAHAGFSLTGDELMSMNGFEALDALFESDLVRTTKASLAWIGAHPPLHRRVSSTGMLMGGGLMPVHTARGGSHALTHSLVKAVTAHGGEIWTTCPVERILVREGTAIGIRLSDDAILPGEEITAKIVVSNLTLVPTFLRLVGEEVIGSQRARQIKTFNYDDQVLFGVYYSLSGDPEFASAAYDPGIQRTMMGYWGGDTLEEMREFGAELVSGVVHDPPMGNWFVPTRADPTQAPPGCHTTFVWVDSPPHPRRWRGRKLHGWDSWPELAEPYADAVTDTYERYAPGFKDLILERHVMTPVDQERNNPSAVNGSMIGGSVVPEQYYENRPLPGIIVKGGTRTFLPGLHLSNSIHPLGASWLATGYIAACEAAEDLGVRDAPWWKAEPFEWFLENGHRLPVNLGVNAKWLANGTVEGR
jgi:beta-carotene ketolase (CrtO type)